MPDIDLPVSTTDTPSKKIESHIDNVKTTPNRSSHSTACSTSAIAYALWVAYIEEGVDIPSFYREYIIVLSPFTKRFRHVLARFINSRNSL